MKAADLADNSAGEMAEKKVEKMVGAWVERWAVKSAEWLGKLRVGLWAAWSVVY